MNEHTYDWSEKIHPPEERKCYHLAVAQVEQPESEIERKIASMLARCLRCDAVTALTANYRKTERLCGERPVYVRALHR